MQIKANGRSAVIVAAGLLAIWASPVRACDTIDCRRIVLAQASEAEAAPAAAAAPAATADAEQPVTRKKSRHSQHSSRKTDKPAAKTNGAPKREPDSKTSSAEKPAEPTSGAPDDGKRADAKDGVKDGVSPTVANAHAQMIGSAGSTETQNLSPFATPATTAGDTLTAVDQGAMATPATGSNADSQIVASDELNELDRAAGDKPAPKVLQPISSSAHASISSDDTWGQTSLIGKIFIAVGGLLTLASAARMFIA